MRRFAQFVVLCLFLIVTTIAHACTIWWVGGTGTWNASSSAHWSGSDGGSGGHAIPTTTDDVCLNGNSGGGTVTISTSNAMKSFDSSGFTGTIAGSTAATVSDGGWTWGSGVTVTYTGAVTFASTSGTLWSITSNGKAFGSGGITIDGVGATIQLADALTITAGSLVVTHGSFDFNGKSATAKNFLSSNSNVRTVALGNSQIALTLATGAAWNTGTITNLTFTHGGSSQIDIQGGNGSFATLTYDDVKISGTSSTTETLTSSGATFRNLTVTRSGGTLGLTGGYTMTGNVDFTGYTGTLTGTQPITVAGNLTMASGMTRSWTGTLTFNGSSGTQTVTSNGITFASAVTVNASGATVQLADAFSTTGTTTLTAGTLDTNGKAFTTSSVGSSGTFTAGASTITLTGTGTVWTASTVNAGTSTIVLNNTSASSKTFAGGGKTYNDLQFAGTGSGTFIVTGANTFHTVFDIDTTAHTVQLPASTTQTFTGAGLALTGGSSGNLTTIQSSSSGTAATVSMAGGWSVNDWLSVKDITSDGAARWFVGKNSTNVSGNSRLRFTGLALAAFIPTLACDCPGSAGGATPDWSPPITGAVSIDFVGDSYTYGTGDTPNATEGFCPLVAADLITQGIPAAFTYVGTNASGTSLLTRHRDGWPGTTVPDHIAAAPSRYGSGGTVHPKVFRILLGRNDATDATLTANWGANMETLIDLLHSEEPDAVFSLGQVPQTGPGTTETRIEAINAQMPTVVADEVAKGVRISLEGLPPLIYPDDYNPDNLVHPNHTGYTKMEPYITAGIVNVLGY